MALSKTEREHPDVIRARAVQRSAAAPLRADELRALAISLGADDAGVASVDDVALAEDRPFILDAFPAAKTVLAIVLRMNREDVRSPTRSVANVEFHQVGHAVDDVARRIVRALEERGVRAINPAMAFPMEMSRFPERAFIVSHKRVAEAAGLGKMGLHRNVIHPRFGNFILLGSILLAAEVDALPRPLDYQPCIGCNLCVAACPVGAVRASGEFDALACYTHNYREFMSGFTDWVENIVESDDAHEYREKVSDAESASMWQSLAYGPNYKAAYCMAVCPAGSDVLGPYLENKGDHVREVVEPLRRREETVYVVAGSDAEAAVRRRFPHKVVKIVKNGLRAQSPGHFMRALAASFSPRAAAGLSATYHFELTGVAPAKGTVVIRDQRITVTPDQLVGEADLAVQADGEVWMRILDGRKSPVAALLTRSLRLRGPTALLTAFSRCFPK
ncbi:MAG: SCP2 sterol-binding domain-containing protein [Polyangiaceae bacterium]